MPKWKAEMVASETRMERMRRDRVVFRIGWSSMRSRMMWKMVRMVDSGSMVVDEGYLTLMEFRISKQAWRLASSSSGEREGEVGDEGGLVVDGCFFENL